LTDSLFFDSDCISAFLWIGNENLLVRLYPGRIVIPKAVYDELSYPGIGHLKARIDALLSAGQAYIMTIDTGTEAYDLYYRLTVKREAGHVIIGKGEAASIALAKQNDGIVASNNLRDIASYITELRLKHITTGDILLSALEKGYITEAQGNTIWSAMLSRRRKLGAASFTAYIQSKQ
jgi:predicted nucleic acid-binding protein